MTIDDLEVLEKLEKDKFRMSEFQNENKFDNSAELPLETLLESLKASEPSYLESKASDGDEEE